MNKFKNIYINWRKRYKIQPNQKWTLAVEEKVSNLFYNHIYQYFMNYCPKLKLS